MYKHIEDMTGTKVTEVPMNTREVLSLFTGTEALGVSSQELGVETGTLALPEMGPAFVRQMLLDAKPRTFADLLQVSGLSHGTDVWLGNAQDLIKSGTCTISEVIGTRDSIMTYLLQKGLDPSMAFQIMEITRKGKADRLLTPEMIDAMKAHGVQDWYVDSCKKIKYMFPKAHAAAYVISAIRLGYYKIHHPLAFYAVYFTVKGEELDAAAVVEGKDAIHRVIARLKGMGTARTVKDDALLDSMQVALEMICRGYRFLPIDFHKSHATQYQMEADGLRLPFMSIKGVGEGAAYQVAKAADRTDIISIDDVIQLGGVGKSVAAALKEHGVFGDLPDSSQVPLL